MRSKGLQNTSPSVEVRSDNRLTLGVERTMFWDSTHYGGHTANSVPSAERQWFFAEGAQNDFFNTYLLLANPNGARPRRSRSCARPSRRSSSMCRWRRSRARPSPPATIRSSSAARSASWSMRPLRSRPSGRCTSRRRRSGCGAAGTTTSEARRPRHPGSIPRARRARSSRTFILMSNPQNTPANVTLRFLLQSGDPIEMTRTIGAQQRLTINPAAEGSAANCRTPRSPRW